MPIPLVEPNDSFTVEPMSDDELEMLFGLPAVTAAKMAPDTVSQWSPTTSAPSQDDTATRNHSQRDHGCLGSALQIFSELHVSSRACTLSVASFDEVRELESVLNSNRKALERLAGILDCPCCREQEVLITTYMAISKALSWYSAALHVDGTTDHVDQSTSVGRVVSPPAFMGGYCLDLQAQTLARAHVVMAQLREHLQPVMARLQKRADSSPPSRSSSTTSLGSCTMSSGTSSSSEVLECYQRALQDAVSDIVDKINVIKRG
ncbi:Putative aflatoxin regulatory protein [Septoria linicola]|uniref:Aflatoxin regulatory protein n=1 Tax=Septoria linicola TaxID=215465 RepID=A0A9Q9AKV5_9PEZI|nr:putative aflatoxin regulatory protein [Septoria linicola]USW47922.1 Putative aflatoxin regulatory protein [Septoria linicola]